MGVEIGFYVIQGYEIDKEVYNDLMKSCYDTPNGEFNDELENDIHEWIVADNYSDEYAYFGKKLASFHEWDNNKHTELAPLWNDDLLEIRNKYIEMIGEKPNGIPKMIAFVHYT